MVADKYPRRWVHGVVKILVINPTHARFWAVGKQPDINYYYGAVVTGHSCRTSSYTEDHILFDLLENGRHVGTFFVAKDKVRVFHKPVSSAA